MEDPILTFFKDLPDPEVDPYSTVYHNGEVATRYRSAFKTVIASLMEHAPADPEDQILQKYLEDVHAQKISWIDDIACSLARFALRKDTIDGPLIKRRQLAYYLWVARGRKNEDLFLTKISGTSPAIISTPNAAVHEYLPEYDLRSQKCVVCGKDASLTCNDCILITNGRTVFATTYCSANCKELHHNFHHRVCRDTRRIGRAAPLFVMAFYILARASISKTFLDVSEKQSMAFVRIINTTNSDAYQGKALLYPYRPLKADSARLVEQVMLYNSSQAVHSHGWPLLELFLRPMCESIDAIEYYPKNMSRTTNMGVSPQLPPFQHFNAFAVHEVLRLNLHSGLQLAFDPACVQFGWQDFLTPWETFSKHRIHRILRSTTVEAIQDAQYVDRVGDECADLTDPNACIHYQQAIIGVFVARQIKEKLKGFKSIATMLDLPVEHFHRIHGIVCSTTASALQHQGSLFEEFLGKSYFDADFNLRATTSLEEYQALKNVWFSEEEYQKYEKDPLMLRIIWGQRFKKHFPAQDKAQEKTQEKAEE